MVAKLEILSVLVLWLSISSGSPRNAAKVSNEIGPVKKSYGACDFTDLR